MPRRKVALDDDLVVRSGGFVIAEKNKLQIEPKADCLPRVRRGG